MPNITASRRNHQSPPSKSGRRFLCLNLSGVAKSVAIRRDRTQWFQSRGREFESLCAHTICRQNSLQNLNTFMTLDVHFCESVPIMMEHIACIQGKRETILTVTVCKIWSCTKLMGVAAFSGTLRDLESVPIK